MTQTLKVRYRRARRARARRAREGVALLVIMIIIVITTFAAAISVQNTTAEMQAVARERMTMHSRYAAEAALTATVSWIEVADLKVFWQGWNALPPPFVSPYTGGHPISPLARHNAVRISGVAQDLIANGVLPVSGPDPGAAIPDLTGSFGPNQSYSMPSYDVDMTDCYEAPDVIGNELGGGDEEKPTKFYCVMTVRGRLIINNGGGAGVQWVLPDGTNTGFQDRTGAAHDARAIIMTPTMMM